MEATEDYHPATPPTPTASYSHILAAALSGTGLDVFSWLFRQLASIDLCGSPVLGTQQWSRQTQFCLMGTLSRPGGERQVSRAGAVETVRRVWKERAKDWDRQ